MYRDRLTAGQQYAIWMIIYSLIIVIGSCFGLYYYKTYIQPESYTIGSITMYDYVPVELKEYYSEEDIVFAQDISDSSFKIENGIATYQYQFEAVDFDSGYLIYVNEKPVGSLKQTANTISGVLQKSFYNKSEVLLENGDISIKFSAQTKTTTLEVSIDAATYPYLKSFFAKNNCVITLAKASHVMGEIVGIVPVTTSTLTINFDDDKNIDRTITGYPGMKYTIDRLESDNYIFLGFELKSGDGILDENVYTFGLEDSVIEAKHFAKHQEITMNDVGSQYIDNAYYDYKFVKHGHTITNLSVVITSVITTDGEIIPVEGFELTESSSAVWVFARNRGGMEHRVIVEEQDYIFFERVEGSPINGYINSFTISYDLV